MWWWVEGRRKEDDRVAFSGCQKGHRMVMARFELLKVTRDVSDEIRL